MNISNQSSDFNLWIGCIMIDMSHVYVLYYLPSNSNTFWLLYKKRTRSDCSPNQIYCLTRIGNKSISRSSCCQCNGRTKKNTTRKTRKVNFKYSKKKCLVYLKSSTIIKCELKIIISIQHRFWQITISCNRTHIRLRSRLCWQQWRVQGLLSNDMAIIRIPRRRCRFIGSTWGL